MLRFPKFAAFVSNGASDYRLGPCSMSKRGDTAEPYDSPLLQAAFEWSPDALAVIDAQRRVLMTNYAFDQQFTGDGSVFAGRSIDDIFADPSAAMAYLAPGSPATVEVVVSGATLDATIRASALERHNAVLLTISRVDTITSQTDDALQRLAGGIAHDFRNVLAVVKGNIDVAMMRSHDARTVSLLTEAGLAAELGAAITDKLFAFAQRSAEPVETVDVAAVLHRAEALLRAVAGNDLCMTVSGTDDRRLLIAASPSGFQGALINLVANARDATPGGGSISVTAGLDDVTEARRVLSGIVAPGRYVRIVVEDTGSGMPDAVRRRALDPFFTTKNADAGFGLGLAQVAAFAAEANGAVEIDSKPGRGCSVSVYLRAV